MRLPPKDAGLCLAGPQAALTADRLALDEDEGKG